MNEEIPMETIQLKEEKVVQETLVEPNPWDSIGGGYVKLESGKSKTMIIIDWKIHKIKKFKDEKTGLLKEQDEFITDVLSEDDKPCKAIFSTTSINALRGLKNVLSKYHPDNKTPRKIRILKIGEGKNTIYGIEELRL